MTAGLYIHIPFCDIKCGYCDFYTVTKRNSLIPSYLQALEKEINSYAADPTCSDLQFGSIFLGGGTPSLLSPEQLSSILQLVRTNFSVVDEAEVTLETNPGTVDLGKLQGFLKAGVNRLSLGVQSFHPEELQFLDRDHSAEQSASAIIQARQAGFANISIDLIFGLPE
ncbi:MAG: coproporphyrinogen-III oxidase family protein [bacterium]